MAVPELTVVHAIEPVSDTPVGSEPEVGVAVNVGDEDPNV